MPLEGYQAQIVDEEGREASAGEIGNLWVQGQSAFTHYWNKPEETARAQRDGWVVTGDKFYRDADGYYFYCGRADDMLKVGGLWVSPNEVENALLAHPAVSEAAVVGRSDESGLTRTVAYLVPRAPYTGSADLAAEIRAFVRERLAAYKCPHAMVFTGEIPKTATGKIQRFRLRER
jgi:benzoate-CoA ligase